MDFSNQPATFSPATIPPGTVIKFGTDDMVNPPYFQEWWYGLVEKIANEETQKLSIDCHLTQLPAKIEITFPMCELRDGDEVAEADVYVAAWFTVSYMRKEVESGDENMIIRLTPEESSIFSTLPGDEDSRGDFIYI